MSEEEEGGGGEGRGSERRGIGKKKRTEGNIADKPPRLFAPDVLVTTKTTDIPLYRCAVEGGVFYGASV